MEYYSAINKKELNMDGSHNIMLSDRSQKQNSTYNTIAFPVYKDYNRQH